MRKRNNNKLYMTIMLGVMAIFIANCHNVHAAELRVLTSKKPASRVLSLQNTKRATTPAIKGLNIKINQYAA